MQNMGSSSRLAAESGLLMCSHLSASFPGFSASVQANCCSQTCAQLCV